MTAMNYSDAAVPEEPIDAQFEPAPDPAQPGLAGRGPGWRTLLAGALIAALAGAGAGAVAGRVLAGAPAGTAQTGSEITARLQALETTLSALKTDLARLESRLANRSDGAGDRQALDDLKERIGRLERTDRSRAAGQDPAPGMLAALDTRLQALEAVAAQTPEIPQPDMAANETARRQAEAALALSAIEAAARRGSSFETDYRILRQAGAAEGPIRRLAPFTDGVATLADLHARFPSVRDDVIEAARLQAPAQAGDRLGWIDRVLGDAVTVRPADQPTNPAEPHLAEAAAALASGDLAGSLKAMARLEGAPVRSAEEWIEEANRRLALEAILEDIRKSLIEPEN